MYMPCVMVMWIVLTTLPFYLKNNKYIQQPLWQPTTVYKRTFIAAHSSLCADILQFV